MPVYSLKKRREDLNWSQGDIADVLGCAQSKISRIENGQQPPTLAQAVVLEGLFGIPCRWWVRGEVRKALS